MFYDIAKESQIALSESALLSLLAIVIVFAVLFMIIGVTELIFKFTGLLEFKKKLDNVQKEESKEEIKKNNTTITDDDMMAAVLVATIDYRNECKKDVKLVNVYEVK